MNEPPKLAQLVLDRLGPQNMALRGDLAEGFHRRQSRLWYWRQVIGAVIAAIAGEVRADPILAARALLTGIGLSAVLDMTFNRLWFGTLSTPVFALTEATWGRSDLNEPYRWISTLVWIGPGILYGWSLTRLFRQQRGMAVVLHCIWVVGWGIWTSVPLVTAADRPEVFFNLQLRLTGIVIAIFVPVMGALLDDPKRSPAARVSE